jgi:predicted small secreted protein
MLRAQIVLACVVLAAVGSAACTTGAGVDVQDAGPRDAGMDGMPPDAPTGLDAQGFDGGPSDAETRDGAFDASDATAADWDASDDAGASDAASDASPAPCSFDEECDDGNPCNGVETCDLALGVCQSGEDMVCDDGLECTLDSCDGEENPETGCVFTLIDEDGDGFAPEHLACDQRGGDCDDTDPDIHPAAERICGDGVDNNCLGYTHDEHVPIWYQDCDGDTYAPSGALAIESCTKPATTAECLDWTERIPIGGHVDCDDSHATVFPGARGPEAGFFTQPYCVDTGSFASGSSGSYSCSVGTLSWDYDCNTLWDRQWSIVSSGSCFNSCTQWGCVCIGDGWVDDAPSCGVSGTWRACSESCTESLTSRQQNCR